MSPKPYPHFAPPADALEATATTLSSQSSPTILLFAAGSILVPSQIVFFGGTAASSNLPTLFKPRAQKRTIISRPSACLQLHLVVLNHGGPLQAPVRLAATSLLVCLWPVSIIAVQRSWFFGSACSDGGYSVRPVIKPANMTVQGDRDGHHHDRVCKSFISYNITALSAASNHCCCLRLNYPSSLCAEELIANRVRVGCRMLARLRY